MMQMAANQQQEVNRLAIYQQQQEMNDMVNAAAVLPVPDYASLGEEEMRPIFMDGHQIGYGKHKRL